MPTNVNTSNNTVVIQPTNYTVTVTNNNVGNTTNVTNPYTTVINVASLGPQGIPGVQGVAGIQGDSIFSNLGGGVFATTSSIQVTGSFTVSGSSTFTNIGPAVFSGSVTINGAPAVTTATLSSLTASSAATASYLNNLNQDLTFNGNLTLNGTASIAYLNVQYETASVIYSSGSNQFGDAANDTQTLYGSVVIPTGSLTVSGSGNFTNNLTVTGSLTMGGSIFTSGFIGYPNNSRYLQFNDADNLVRLQGFNGIRLMTYDTVGYTDVIKIDGNIAARTVQVTGSLRTSGSITILGTDRTLYTQAVTNITADGYLYFGDSARIGSTGGSNIHYASGYYSQAAHQFYGGTATGMTSVVDIYGGQSGKPALRASGSVHVTGSLSISGVTTFAQASSINGSGNLAIGAFSVHSSFGFATFSQTTLLLTGGTFTSTTGNQVGLSFGGGFTPTSGTATYTAYSILPTISQSSAATGITRGLYVNPTLTSAANFRAIETTSGSVLFSHGSTPLMFVSSSGNVGINTTGSSAYNLDVNGTARFNNDFNLFRSDGTYMLGVGNAAAVFDWNPNNTATPTFRVRGNAVPALLHIKSSEDRVGIGTSGPNASAMLDITSTTKGFLPPRTATTASITSPAQGLMTYLTGSTNEGLYYYNSGSQTGWHKILTNTGSQSITGSLIATSFTGSLQGTATNAVTASYLSTGPFKDARVLGTLTYSAQGYGSYLGFTSGSIYVGDLLTLEAPIDISLLVESPTTNRTAKIYLSTTTSSIAGAFEIGQAAFGPATSIVGRFARTIINKYVAYSYGGGEDTPGYDRYNITYIRATGSSDTQISGSIADIQYYDTNVPEEALRYILISVPNGMNAYNLNVQSGGTQVRTIYA
jgi:hypothetical protein